MYYVYDKFGDGYTFVTETLPEEYKYFIGEYSLKEDANTAALDYENYIQEQIDKAVENWFYDEEDFDDDEEDY